MTVVGPPSMGAGDIVAVIEAGASLIGREDFLTTPTVFCVPVSSATGEPLLELVKDIGLFVY